MYPHHVCVTTDIQQDTTHINILKDVVPNQGRRGNVTA